MEIKFDSNEEMYFSWLLEELGEIGLLNDYEVHEPKMNLYNGAVHTKYDYKKTKINSDVKTLLEGHIYTPDFIIQWNDEARHVLIDNLLEDTGAPFKGMESRGDIGSIIEVKPNFDKHNMTRAFKINQKWVMQKFGYYVQLIKPQTFFKQFMTPTRYLTTDKSGKDRKLPYEPITPREWLEKRKQELKRRKGIK